jgi:hypothetical protein
VVGGGDSIGCDAVVTKDGSGSLSGACGVNGYLGFNSPSRHHETSHSQNRFCKPVQIKFATASEYTRFDLQQPLSEELLSLGAAGLAALDYLDKTEVSPEAWRMQQLAQTDAANAPQANLLLVIVQPVRQLIEATAGQIPKP